MIISKKSNIIFGIFFFIIFFSYGIYIFVVTDAVEVWTFVLSLVFLLVTIINPNLLTFLNILWIQFGILLGKLISPIVMGFVFFFVLTPIGVLVRIFKKDVMGLKRGASSYWINRDDKIQSMRKQF